MPRAAKPWIRRFRRGLTRFLRDTRGASLFEYAVIAAIMVGAIIVGARIMGSFSGSVMTQVSSGL